MEFDLTNNFKKGRINMDIKVRNLSHFLFTEFFLINNMKTDIKINKDFLKIDKDFLKKVLKRPTGQIPLLTLNFMLGMLSLHTAEFFQGQFGRTTGNAYFRTIIQRLAFGALQPNVFPGL